MTIATKDGRKFSLILYFGTVASVALFLRFASFMEWAYFILPWGGLYLAANVVQKYRNGGTESSIEPPAPKP